MKNQLDGQLYTELKTSDAANEWAWKYYSDVLNMDPQSPLYVSIFSYTGSCSDHWNTLLRNCLTIEQGSFLKTSINFAKNTQEEIENIYHFLCQHTIPENIIVYRYTQLKDIQCLCGKKILRPKLQFSDKAFFSTTLVRSLLRHFACEKHCNCVLKLYLPQGLPGAYVSFKDKRSHLDEQEILLPCNTKFEILKVHWLRFPIVIECKAIIK